MSEFKVGDAGKTRGGGDYRILSVNCSTKHVGEAQPLKAEVLIDGEDQGPCYFYPNGRFMEEESAFDLLPPRLSDLPAACSAYTSACERFEAVQAELERAKQAVADARIDVARALESEA